MSDRRLYTESMAARVREGGGGSYRPSNGSEGDMFQQRWCHQCTKDLHAPIGGGCPILCASMCFQEDDPDYPPEWTFDESGQPCCTAFDSIWEDTK